MSVFATCSDKLTQSGDNNNTITRTDKDAVRSFDANAYGKTWINSLSKKCVSWDIRFNETKGGFAYIGYGIVSNQHHGQTDKDLDADHAYLLYGDMLRIDGKKVAEPGYRPINGDTVTLTLDMENAQLSVCKNGDKKVVCSNIGRGNNIKYRFALALCASNHSVTITFNDDTTKEEEKKNDIDNGEILKFVTQISNLENINKQKTSEIAEYIKKTESMQDTISSLQAEVNKYKQENEELINKVSSLEEERKEFAMNINELKEENKRLKLKTINSNNYDKWGVDEIVYWIISLDPKTYGEYEEVLTKELTEEDVNGECLDDVDMADIKRWGVKSFKHSKYLLKEIQALIQNKNKNDNDNPMLNEGLGLNAPTAYI